jgi:hypothetical protein
MNDLTPHVPGSKGGKGFDTIGQETSSTDESQRVNRNVRDQGTAMTLFRKKPDTIGSLKSFVLGLLLFAGMFCEEEMALRQQTPSFPFQPSAMMSQHPMRLIPPEQMRYLQDMRRAEQVMMTSKPSTAHGVPSRGPPQFGGRMPFQGFDAFRQMPGTRWDLKANAPFIPQDRPDPRASLVAQSRPLQAMMSSQIMPREEEMHMIRYMLLRQQEEAMKMKRPGGWASLPANSFRDDAPAEQWGHQIAASQVDRLAKTIPISKLTKTRKRHVKSFPVKLMEAIHDYYDETTVAWLADGKSFVVVDPDVFCDKVISKAFKGGRYASFVRKLNRWGFGRLVSGTGMDCFHHPLFQRNRMDLCILITCRDSTSGSFIDPALIQNVQKPSLAGIEKYFEHVKNKEMATADQKILAGNHDAVEENSAKEQGEDQGQTGENDVFAVI